MARIPSPSRLPTRSELAVTVSGVTSMGLQILAFRLVVPQFGSNIYTSGSIITVFLAALSLGYHQGGKRATGATTREMSWLMLATAAYVAVVVFASTSLMNLASTIPLPAQYSSLPAVTLLFGPPAYFLGFISPYAAELSIKEGIGEASGHVYALGTIGSLLGTFGTTFWLIPTLSVSQIGFVFGLMLVVTAVALEAPTLSREPVVAVCLVTVLLVGAVAAPSFGYAVEGEVVYETQTPYQELRVADLGDTRTLYLDGQQHSAMDLEDPDRHVFEYTRYFHLPSLMVDDPDDIDRVLFIGGGGFTGPKDFEESYDVAVDVAEIDPDVTDVAKTYFDLEESANLTVYDAGGREFLQETEESYDLIVLDAYKMDKVPFELTTEEFMTLTSDRLTDDGMLVANVISAPSGSASAFYRANYVTMDAVFPEVYSFRTSDSGAVQNIQVIASKDDQRLSQETLSERNADRDIGIDLEREVDSELPEPNTDDVPVLRDDRAPVDSLLDPMVGQRYVIEESESEPESQIESGIGPPPSQT